jgi:hypothetical protein
MRPSPLKSGCENQARKYLVRTGYNTDRLRFGSGSLEASPVRAENPSEIIGLEYRCGAADFCLLWLIGNTFSADMGVAYLGYTQVAWISPEWGMGAI